MIKALDENIVSVISQSLYNKLNQGLHTGDLIDVTGLRQVGKTTALVKFARERHLPIIACNHAAARCIKDNFDYQNVYSITFNNMRGTIREACVDELVDLRKVRELGINVVTGFFTYMP